MVENSEESRSWAREQDAEIYGSVNVEITHNNKKLILATVYRPPKLQAPDDTALYNEIQSLIQLKNAIVIHDFNCANVDWRLLIGAQEGKVKKLRAYVGAARSLGAHIRDIGPSTTGGKEPIIPGQRARVTTGLPKFTFCDSEVIIICLTSLLFAR